MSQGGTIISTFTTFVDDGSDSQSTFLVDNPNEIKFPIDKNQRLGIST